MSIDWSAILDQIGTAITNVVTAFATSLVTYAPVLIGLAIGVTATGAVVAFGKDVFKGLTRAISVLVPY